MSIIEKLAQTCFYELIILILVAVKLVVLAHKLLLRSLFTDLITFFQGKMCLRRHQAKTNQDHVGL